MPPDGEVTPVAPVAGAERSLTAFERALTAGRQPTAVYGLGPAGLREAAGLAAATGNTIGTTRDGDVVRRLRRGRCPVAVDPGVTERVERTLETDALRVVANPAVVATQAAVHLVAVPAGVGAAAPEALTDTLRRLATGLDHGDLVCLTSPVRPGTCRDLVAPLLTAESGLAPTEYGLAATPRVRSADDADPRRLVGSSDDRARRAGGRFFACLTDERVSRLGDAQTAEQLAAYAALAGPAPVDPE